MKKPIYVIKIILLFSLVCLSLFFFIKSNELKNIYDFEASKTPVPTLNPPMLNYIEDGILLRVGSIGPEVIELQEKLHSLGYYSAEIDGQFGNGTKDSVALFQQNNGLNADGIAGSDTLNILYSDKAKPLNPN